MAVFKYAEAEAFGKKAINAKRHDCPNSTYGDLAKLYLLRGDFQQTHSALKKLREIGAPPKYRDQFEKGNRSARARLFFALGMLNGAEELTRPAFKAPDRGGMTSSSEERIRFGGAIDHAMVLQARLEDEREKRSIRPLGEWFDRTLAIQALEFEHWEVGRVALHLVAHDEELETNIRPYMAALLPWYTGTLIELFGTGVVSKAVARARELDRDAPKTEAFYDAFDGEIAWRRGDYEEAIALAKSALTNLPKEEKLLRWRTRTWLGDAYAARGQAGFASAEWGIVLEHYPSALRHLGVKLAVTIEPDDDPKSLEIATRLRDSHRLRFDIPAFLKLNVTAGERHEICLMTTGNHRYNCVLEPEAQELQDEEKQDPVLALLDRFHRKMFQPKIELSQADINSLDGSPVRVNADSVMEGLLGKKEKKE
jgi:tetratricopeptide (TPR) repeat protein